MESKERFLTALNGGIPDRVPLFDFLFQQELFEAVIGRKPEAYNEVDAVECAIKLGHDAVWVPAGGFAGYSPIIIDNNSYIDEWGTTYQKDGHSWPIDAPIAYPIKSWEDLKNWKLPDATDENRITPMKNAIKLAAGRIAILGGVMGPLTNAYFLMGMEELCINMYEDPALVTELFRLANVYNIEAGLRLSAAGADAIVISDDLGYSNALFLSPEMMREYVLPYMFELVNAFTSHGIKVILHCDGNINSILEDLATCGISGLHPIERKAHMDLKYVKEKYGKIICPIGNVDSSITLPYGTKEDVINQTKECLKIAAPGGGYILASDHSLHGGIPIENILTMIETAKKYGTYPINID